MPSNRFSRLVAKQRQEMLETKRRIAERKLLKELERERGRHEGGSLLDKHRAWLETKGVKL